MIVASVSCIYGLGSPGDYKAMLVMLEVGQEIPRHVMLERLVDIQYTRNEIERTPGTFRVRGDTVDIFPSYTEDGVRVSFFGDEVEALQQIDPLTGKVESEMQRAAISPAKHFVTPGETIKGAIGAIREELEARVAWFEQRELLLEAQRIRMRTEYDLEILQEIGFCSGIENYSRFLTGRDSGDRPYTLIDYFPGEFLTIIDESHATMPQIQGMYNGDMSRKSVLVEHGFRLPSALDNRPLQLDEFQLVTGPTIYVSATPAEFERDLAEGVVVPQVIRPTGIVDPEIEIRPLATQIDDLVGEVKQRAEHEERVLVSTLTKKTAEDLSEYMREIGLRVKYLHSEIDTIERVELIRALRRREFDCLVGINLLREGLDIPEVSLVAILDADKEGFLRSETSLIQTAGRAARNVGGKVILYADDVTPSMQRLLDITTERRERQLTYNQANGITPKSIVKEVQESLRTLVGGKAAEDEARRLKVAESGEMDVNELIEELEAEMQEAATSLEYERAAMLRDQIFELRAVLAPDVKRGKRGKQRKGKKYPRRT